MLHTTPDMSATLIVYNPAIRCIRNSYIEMITSVL